MDVQPWAVLLVPEGMNTTQQKASHSFPLSDVLTAFLLLHPLDSCRRRTQIDLDSEQTAVPVFTKFCWVFFPPSTKGGGVPKHSQADHKIAGSSRFLI